MKFSAAALSTCLLVGGASAFSPAPTSTSFVASRVSNGASPTAVVVPHAAGCACAACTGRTHAPGCACAACGTRRSFVKLYSTAEAETEEAADVPAEVEAMDGIESADEAHNSERPARKSLKKKSPAGKPLSEFNVGDSVKAKVKAIASYGAFMDIGAETDGLLHISQLSVDYVADVKDVLQTGKEYDVRIVNIDEKKNQVALTLLTEAQQEEAKEAAAQPRGGGQRGGGGGGGGGQQRRDDGPILAKLAEAGWDSTKFVEGTVVNTVDFGAFVRVNVADLNSELEGEIDGLVHISALSNSRVDAVTSIVNVDDKVQVRVKDVANRKVSLSMVSVEDEEAKRKSFGGGEPVREGNKNWKKDMETVTADMPTFQNKPLVVDLRK